MRTDESSDDDEDKSWTGLICGSQGKTAALVQIHCYSFGTLDKKLAFKNKLVHFIKSANRTLYQTDKSFLQSYLFWPVQALAIPSTISITNYQSERMTWWFGRCLTFCSRKKNATDLLFYILEILDPYRYKSSHMAM